MEPTEPTHPGNTGKTEQRNTPEARELTAGEKFSQDLDTINAVIATLLRDSSIDPAVVTYAWNERADISEAFVDSLEPTQDNLNPRPRVQFDILVDKAFIFERVGNTIRYLEELDDAEAFARAADLYDVLPSLTDELDDKVLELENSPEEIILKLRGYISFANRYYLRELLLEGIDYEDFLGDVYGMILDEDGDPDEVFAQLGITE